MFKVLGRISLASALLLLGAAPALPQGAVILGQDDWTETGNLVTTPGPFSGVTIFEVEPNDGHLTANAVSVGDDFAGSIDNLGGDFDYISFTVAANESILAVTVPGGGTLTDTNLSLYDTDGTTLLAYNDDFTGLFSRISHTFSTAGTYYLAVGSYLATEGSYVMELRTDGGDLHPAGGWAYIQYCLEAIAGGVTIPSDGSVAVLGSADSAATSLDAGGAYHHCVPFAAANSSLSGVVNFFEGAAEITTFFTDLGLGTVNPQIIVIAGSGATNDLDFLESAVLTANAAGISAYLDAGGGLLSHGDDYVDGISYGWLPAVFPGAGMTLGDNLPVVTSQGRFSVAGLETSLLAEHAHGSFAGHGMDVFVSAPSGPVSGPWSGITVNETEVNDDYLSANLVAVGDDFAGAIDAFGADMDYVSFVVGADVSVLFETVDVGGLNDTRLFLFDTDGVTQLAFDDDSGPGLLARISHTFAFAGTYFILIDSFGTNVGGYSLQVRTIAEGDELAVVVGSLPGPWDFLGNALAGVNGEPLFVGAGPLTPGSPASLSLTGGAPNTTAFLVVGLAAVYTPLKGGILVPNIVDLLVLPTNGSGELGFAGSMSASSPSGLTIFMQYWLVDAAGPHGLSASNGLSATTP